MLVCFQLLNKIRVFNYFRQPQFIQHHVMHSAFLGFLELFYKYFKDNVSEQLQYYLLCGFFQFGC
jgi:hypothetical protein